MSIYFGINNEAVKTQSAYIGVRDVARKILKMYIGVNGKAQLFYDSTSGGNSDDNDIEIGNNAIYFYNKGDECTDITGGWVVWETDTSELCTHTKSNNCLEIICNSEDYLNTKTVVDTGFQTTNLNVSMNSGYRVGIQYSFICDIINDSNYYFTIGYLTSGGGGATLSDKITADSQSEEIKKVVYTDVDSYGMPNLHITLTLWDYNNGYCPSAKLKIYKVWYEPIPT